MLQKLDCILQSNERRWQCTHCIGKKTYYDKAITFEAEKVIYESQKANSEHEKVKSDFENAKSDAKLLIEARKAK